MCINFKWLTFSLEKYLVVGHEKKVVIFFVHLNLKSRGITQYCRENQVFLGQTRKKCIDPSVNCPVISCDWNICLCWTRSKVINMSMGNDIWFSMIGLWRFCYSLQIWSNDLWDIHRAKTSVQWFLMTRLIDDWQTTFLSLRQSIYRHIRQCKSIYCLQYLKGSLDVQCLVKMKRLCQPQAWLVFVLFCYLWIYRPKQKKGDNVDKLFEKGQIPIQMYHFEMFIIQNMVSF